MCVCVCGRGGEGRVMDSVTMGILTQWEGRRASIRHLVCVRECDRVCVCVCLSMCACVSIFRPSLWF